MFFVLHSGLGIMKAPVLVYILVILIMSDLAMERYLQLELQQTLFTECSAILFLISDAMLPRSPVGACNVFRPTECLLFELIIYNHAKSVKKLSCSPKKFA